MFCVYCGSKINNEFVFCWKCGKKIPEILSDDEISVLPEQEGATFSEKLPEDAVKESGFENDEEEAVFEDDEEETVVRDDENITKEKINTSNGTNNISSNMSFFYEKTPEGNVITSFYGDSEEVNLPESIRGEKMIGFSTSLFYKQLYDNEINAEENKRRKLFIPKGITLITDIGNDRSYLMGNDELNFAEFAVEEDHPAFSVENGVLYNKDKTKLLRIPNKISRTINLPDSLLEISEEDLRRAAELTVGKKNEGFYGKDGLILNKDKTKLIFCSHSKAGSVRVPVSVTEIVKYAFYNCSNITEITMSKNVTKIGEYAMAECTHLTEMKLPSGLLSLGEAAFCGCENLVKISMPKSLMEIGASAFRQCRRLDGIRLPNSVSKIGGLAFANCEELTEIKLPLLITEICCETFYNCKKLKSVVIPSGVLNIGYYAFSGCTSLENVTIPETVTEIEAGAFHECASITGITIPESVTDIGPCAFEGCSFLESIIIPEGIEKLMFNVFMDCEKLKDITLPKSITSIGEYAFSGCTSLQTIDIPLKTSKIGECAFMGCKKLWNITLPNGIKYIPDQLFYGCKNLDSITIPDTVVSIGCAAFRDCEKLPEVWLPESVEYVRSDAFINCANLHSLHFAADTIITEGNDCCIIDLYVETDDDDFEIILDKSASIAIDMFSKFTELREVTLSDEMIENLSYNHLRKLMPGTVNAAPNSKKYSGNKVIYSIDQTTNRKKGLIYISRNLSSLELVPDSVTDISRYAFDVCQLSPERIKNDDIFEIYCDDDDEKEEDIRGIAVKESLMSHVKAITKEVDLRNFSVLYRESDFVYDICDTDNCRYIKLIKYTGNESKAVVPSVINGKPVKRIGTQCFRNNYLSEIVIPQGVSEIENEAFFKCGGLSKVAVERTDHPIRSNTIKDCPALQRIETPKGTLYLPFIGWKNMIKKAPTPSLKCNGDKSVIISTRLNNAWLKKNGINHECNMTEIGQKHAVDTYDHLIGERPNNDYLTIEQIEKPKIISNTSDLENVTAYAFDNGCIYLSDGNNIYYQTGDNYPQKTDIIIGSGWGKYNDRKVFRMMKWGNYLFVVCLYIHETKEEWEIMMGDYGGTTRYNTILPEIKVFDTYTNKEITSLCDSYNIKSPVCSIMLNKSNNLPFNSESITVVTESLEKFSFYHNSNTKPVSSLETVFSKKNRDMKKFLDSVAAKNEEIVWFTENVVITAGINGTTKYNI